MSLIAKLPILYSSRQYRVGDTLPATNPAMVDAWIESGAAEYKDTVDPEPAPKAKPVAAEAGLPGKSSDGDPEALVGKVSKRGRARK